MKLKKTSKHYLFTDGWSVFVADNQLETGNFVVFWLMDNYSTFHVQLYDRTCCDKRLSSSRFFPGFPGICMNLVLQARPNVFSLKSFHLTLISVQPNHELTGENSRNLDLVARVKKESDEKEDESEMLIGPSKNTTHPSFVTILSASTDDQMVCVS